MPLTERGRAQAAASADFLADIPFSCVYTSDLARAYDTGKALADSYGIPLYPTPQLREIFAGDWEGKTYAQLEEEFPDSYGVWRHRIGLAQCPHGESVEQLQKRIHACILSIVQRHPNETICIATHATPIRVMECIWTNTPLAEIHTIPWVSNASVTIAAYDNDDGQLIARDLHDHLGDLHTVLAKNV